MTALAAAAALPVPGGLATGRAAALACLFGDPAWARAPGAEERRLAGLPGPGFPAGAGWDPVRLMLEVPAGHRLLGWQQCRVAGCISRGDGPEQVCLGCRLRLAASGRGPDEVDLVPARGWQRPGQCQVAGCPRTWRTPRLPLCRAHLHQQREVLKIGLGEFPARPGVRPLPPCGPCRVTACVRDRDGTSGACCRAHAGRRAKARKAGPGLDEQRWRATTAAIARPGLVSLRGLPPGLITEILSGLQQRCAAGRRTSRKLLRTICDDMRRQQVATIAEFTPGNVQRPVAGSFLPPRRRADASAETEKAAGTWDLALSGHGGRMTFTAITRDWLRETARRWVLEELPRRRGRKAGGTAAAYVSSVARLPESLRARSGGGQVPAAPGRADIGNFLNRLAFQQSAGQVSRRLRERTCRDLRQVSGHVRARGLTRPGQPAAGLSDDFALLAGDVPHPPQPGEPSRDLPAEIIARLRGHLDELEAISSRRMRVAAGLLIGTGRRPGEICTPGYGCPDRGSDGAPVLVYDNHKAARLGRRLPVSEATARLITAPQARTRARFPHTPAAELKLLPAVFASPGGRKGHPDRKPQRAAPHLDRRAAAAATCRRQRIRHGHDHLACLSARLRPAARRRRRSGRRAARADGPPAAGRDPPVLPGRPDTPPPGRRPGRGDAVRPARQPHLAAGKGAAGLRARPPRRRRGRRPVRGLRRAVQRQGRRAGLPVPVPLRRLRPLPHRRVLPARPAGPPR